MAHDRTSWYDYAWEIVFVADYIEPYRNKAANLDTIRYLAFTDIDKAVLQILDDTINYLNKKGNPIDSITWIPINFINANKP
mgnify:CR=1 FL=1